MTDETHPSRHRRPAATRRATRHLAAEAARAGEPLADISRRLDIPRSTLMDWARADGFRASDLAAEAARAEKAGQEAAALREEADTLARQAAEAEGHSSTEAGIHAARLRVGTLLEAGLMDAAEEDMRAARRLTSLARFAAPVAGEARAAHERMTDLAADEAGRVLALQVCECWAPGDPVPGALNMDVSAIFQARFVWMRQILEHVMPEEFPTDPAEKGERLWQMAQTGGFDGYHLHFRQAVDNLRAEGSHDMAARLEVSLDAEAGALPGLRAWCAAHGLTCRVEVG